MRPSNLAKISAAAVLALSVGVAVAPQAPAAPSSVAQRDCFWERNVTGFASQDDRTVNLRVGVREVYQLDLWTTCTDVNFAHRIHLDTRGFSSICRGTDVTLIVRGPAGLQRCQVRSIRHLTPEEVAALPRLARP
jgi:hypothetical protein